MAEEPRQSAIRSALHKQTIGAPLSSFAQLVPDAKPDSERLHAKLDDGATVVFERRSAAVHGTIVRRRAEGGSDHVLEDGVYRLTSGIAFQVVGGTIDFGLVLAEPGSRVSDPNAPPMNPHPPYQAWKEVVAIMDDLLLTLGDPAAITDVIRVVAPGGENYYAVQLGLEKPYQAYVVTNGALSPIRSGEYALSERQKFRIEDGEVHPQSLKDLKAFAHERTRLPL